MDRKPYPSDLTDGEWTLLKPLIPPAKPGGRPRRWEMREILNAIFYFYVLRSGCAWRMLPHDFPPWQTVYDYFISGSGGSGGSGRSLIGCYGSECGVRRGVKPHPVQRSSTVSRLRRQRKGDQGLRWGQASQWAEEASVGRYHGVGAEGESPCGQHLGSGRGQDPVELSWA